MTPDPRPVTILLCTRNGAKFLALQLESLERQTHTNWRVWASDDGSQDRTREILAQFQAHWGEQRLSVRSGPGRGYPAQKAVSPRL